jgi:glyoxylase-like metal-dependent hydrolase (beta-lactamase superfamily II)
MAPVPSFGRRDFLKLASACATHLALMAAPFPLSARARWSSRAQRRIAAREPFGRLETLGEGLWAFISTPLGGDYTTVCNGGIIAGDHGTLVVEAFQTPEGARWMARRARQLTGRWPTHVLVTHYHGDHSNGVPGFRQSSEEDPSQVPVEGEETPSLRTTVTTRRLRQESFPDDTDQDIRALWADVVPVAEDAPSTLDLGNRVVEVTPRLGHTPSDLSVALPDEGVLWCGDLVWNGMFPNYMDAVPSQLSRAVREVRSRGAKLFIPGHGPLAGPEDLERYAAIITGVEETARTARRRGWNAQEAAERHRIPESLGEWTLFNPGYIQRAMEAWMREWS